mmetsp:Transcript_2461/g.6325  ORF Transcript_2461/g.6325 Transcript_2461/m.6325 type:complete len:245 (-) Transcript_2461:484-1218(-)
MPPARFSPHPSRPSAEHDGGDLALGPPAHGAALELGLAPRAHHVPAAQHLRGARRQAHHALHHRLLHALQPRLRRAHARLRRLARCLRLLDLALGRRRLGLHLLQLRAPLPRARRAELRVLLRVTRLLGQVGVGLLEAGQLCLQLLDALLLLLDGGLRSVTRGGSRVSLLLLRCERALAARPRALRGRCALAARRGPRCCGCCGCCRRSCWPQQCGCRLATGCGGAACHALVCVLGAAGCSSCC